MSIDSGIARLVGDGVQLWQDGEALRVLSPSGRLADPDTRFLRDNKPQVLAFLGGRRIGPVSGVQRRLWFLSRLDPSGTGYTFSLAYRISGRLAAEDLDTALRTVLARHPGLRATFSETGGAPLQFTHPDPAPDSTFLDCTGAPAEEVDARMRAVLVRPFDLEKGPLLRTALLRTAEDEHLWGVTVHHLVADGRTLGILTQDLSDALAGRTPPRPELGYPDFVHWERTRAGSAAVAANADYWTDRLTGAPELDFPLDRPRPAVREHAGGRVDVTVPPDLTDRLTRLAAEESTTLFSVLLAVRLAQLHHYTGATDITVGVPVSGRLDTAFERTAGCFVSTVIPRVDLSGDPAFTELLRRVDDVCTEAWDHQDYAYEEVVGRLATDRDPSRNALFQTFFAYQNVFEELIVPGARTRRAPFATGTVQFDLELHVEAEADGGLTGTFLYDRALFDDTTVRTMGERWLVLTEQLLDAPRTPLSRTSMATPADRELLAAVNRTDAPYDADARADQLVARRAERHPGTTALVFRGTSLTYGQLRTAADGLAERIAATAGRGARVGILLDRSPDMVVAVLAALRAGAVFVPLSPDLPPERLADMAADTSMRYALTRPDLASRLPDGVRPLDVTGPPADRPAAAGPRPAGAGAGPDDPAYVLFTSGSTGRPKGVEVSHRSLVNLLQAMAKEPGLAGDDVMVAVTGLFFDIALLELLGPLAAGARVVVADAEEVADPVRLAALLDVSAATVMQATPSTWQMLVDAGWTGHPDLRAWCGGEALSRDLADRLVVGCAEVWNLYGPTETTIWSARSKVRPTGPIRIGRPVENTRFHVLDVGHRPAPPGVPGELHIAGDGVALGYLGRPEETERRFPVLKTPGGGSERVYRTGDLVRQLPDGDLVYLGRTDLQLKVRGHRVEPEEIEHALRRHPAVRDAVVALGPTGTLVGHLVAHRPVAEADLEAFAARLLPAHMVPRAYAFHDAFPQTANRKVDRKALAASGAARRRKPYEAPTGPDETFLAETFAGLLGLPRVGRHDDFFQIGGHSLLTVRVVHAVKERFGLGLGLHEMFRSPTVATLAATVADRLERAASENKLITDALDRIEEMSEEEVQRLLDRLDT